MMSEKNYDELPPPIINKGIRKNLGSKIKLNGDLYL